MSENKKPKVFVTRDLFPHDSIAALREHCEVIQWQEDREIERQELLAAIADVEAIYCTPMDARIDAELLDHGNNLKVIGTFSVGLDHIDIPECKKRGVQVGHTPNVLTDGTAEFTVSLLLAVNRRIVEANKIAGSGHWPSWQNMWMCGGQVAESTVGVVGFGRIGSSVAEKLKGFRPKEILFFDPYIKSDCQAAVELGAEGVSFEELLTRCDYICCCVFLSEQTRNLFNRDAFSKMKSNAVLVNTSRGPVVDHEALYEALTTGKLRAAGLDVTDPEPLPPDHKLHTLDNCVITPHIGSAATTTRHRMGDLCARNILAGIQGKPLPTPAY